MVSAKLQEEDAYKLFINHTNIIHFLTQNYSLVMSGEEELTLDWTSERSHCIHDFGIQYIESTQQE